MPIRTYGEQPSILIMFISYCFPLLLFHAQFARVSSPCLPVQSPSSVVKHPVILFVFPHHHFCWQNHNLGWWKVPSIQHSYGKWPMSRWFSTWWFTSKSQIILNHYQPPTHTKIRANLYWLVVDLPLWKICSSVGMIIPNTCIWKNKTWSKPPISKCREKTLGNGVSTSFHFAFRILIWRFSQIPGTASCSQQKLPNGSLDIPSGNLT